MGRERYDRFFFDEALALIKPAPKLVVEIGGIRDARPVAYHADGHSTLRWLAAKHLVTTIDISPEAIAVTKRLAKNSWRWNGVCEDAMTALPKHEHIDLLYMDGPHPKHEQGAEFSLACFLTLRCTPAVVLIDDCDVKPGKGDKLIPHLLSVGYELWELDRQALLQLKSSA